MAKPKPSEWGKLSAGQTYIFWATDFARAVFSLGLGENVGMLFWYVLENSWGSIRTKQRGQWPDPVGVAIGFKELADEWGVTKQRVYDAEKWLLKARMIYETDGLYWVNKNAHEWVHPVSLAPLLAGKRMAYVIAGRTRTDKPDPKSQGNVTTLPIDESESDKVTSERYQSNVTTLPEEHANTSLHIGSARELNSIQIETNNITPSAGVISVPSIPKETTVLPATPDGPADPKMEPHYPTENDILDIISGPHPVDEVRSREVFSLIWRASKRAAVCNAYYRRQRFHSADAWTEAVRILVGKGTPIYGIGIIDAQAGEIEANGGPITPTPSRSEPRTPASPLTPSQQRREAFSAGFKRKAEEARAAAKAREESNGERR